MTIPFGIDISKYQASGDMKQLPDWAKMRANTDFVALRAGISWGYEDPLFSTGWNALQAHCRMAYHVLYPSQDGVRQADWFWDIVSRAGFDTAHDRLVVDVELDQGCAKAQITTALLAYMARILYLSGRNPVIYSRASWINAHVDVSGLPALTEWWLAHYLTAQPSPAYTPEKPSPPALPKGVSNWLIHQTGERGNGGAVGVRSHYVDTNRWNGTLEDLRAYFGLGEVVPPEPEPPVEKLFDAKVTTDKGIRLKTRYTPAGKERPDTDWLQSQAIVPVYETHSTGWWRVAPEAWSSTLWMKRVGNEPPPITEKYYGALYWQRDPRWKDKPLGTSGTIGSYGCVMTAETNVLNQLGIVTNPVVNNAWRTANGGYHNGNLIVWEKVSEQHPDIIWEGKTWNPTDAQIKQKIAAGYPLVMLVDHNEGTPVLNEHWVNSIPSPADDDAIWIHDPWDNLTIRLRDRYKKPIQQFSSYRRAI